MEANPYERRGRRGQADMAMAGPWTALGRPQFEVRPAIAVEDLDAMVHSAMGRAERQARARLTTEHQDELVNARRLAWEEGHDVGNHEGRRELLREMDERHGESVRRMVEELGQIAERDCADDRDVLSREVTELRHALRSAVRQLERLVEAHHAGFHEPPF